MRQDITEYKLQLQSQRNIMVARSEDTDIQNKLMKKNKDLAEAMEELQVRESNQLQSEKTGLRGLRPELTQTGLCSYRRWLEV